MTGMLPTLRWLLGLWTSRTAARTAPTPSLTPEPFKETTPPPCEAHRPPQPRDRAETCGQCGKPLPDTSVTGEWCNSICASQWISARSDVVYKSTPIPILPPRLAQDPIPNPPWLAQWDEHHRKCAAALIEPRKSPTTETEAA